MNDNKKDYLSDVINSEEYIHNKMQIDSLKMVLIKQNHASEKVVDWLIDAVEKNTIALVEAKYKHEN